MDLVISDISNFDSIYSDMKTQFPESELNEYFVYHNLLLSDKYKLYLAKEDDEFIGYVLLCNLVEEKFLWVDYISVLKQFQSRGYGHKIFKCLLDKYNTYNGIYLEVEKPDETDIKTIRRINFYRTLGAEKLNIEYYYPNKSGCIPMDLYFLPISEKKIPFNVTNNIVRIVFNLIHSHHSHMQQVLDRIVV